MAVAIQMIHTKDPKQEIYDGLPADYQDVQILSNDVLVGMYVRPERTQGGIILSDKSRGEEQYQGKAALILKMGNRAFVADETHDWGDQVPKVGDWVAVWVMDASRSMELGQRRCRIVEDVHIKMVLPRPDIIL